MRSPVLLDTNVVSELARTGPEPRVVKYVKAQEDLWLSALTIHEIVYGAECAPGGKRKARLLAWVSSIEVEFAGRIIAVDAAIAATAGRLRAAAAEGGRTCDPVDALIAATALSVGAAVATRNTRDFKPLGVTVIDPWSE